MQYQVLIIKELKKIVSNVTCQCSVSNVCRRSRDKRLTTISKCVISVFYPESFMGGYSMTLH